MSCYKCHKEEFHGIDVCAKHEDGCLKVLLKIVLTFILLAGAVTWFFWIIDGISERVYERNEAAKIQGPKLEEQR